MTVSEWMMNRYDDNFIIDNEDGKTVYDARRTIYDPSLMIMESVITDLYNWDGVIVLEI